MNVKKKKVDLEVIPAEIPSLRIAAALENRSSNNLCFVVGGGLGDRICAEPTIRYAIDSFKGVSISLICETPELFNHLHFFERFDLKRRHPIMGRHLYLYTYPKNSMFSQFINANGLHCVDLPAIAALRHVLPIEYRQVVLDTPRPSHSFAAMVGDLRHKYVLIHCGKAWPSRTFTSSWLQRVVQTVLDAGKTAVLFGNNCVDMPEYPSRVVDTRDQLSMSEYLYMVKNCEYLITNDSSPLHIAAAGTGKIAFVSTCRNGELLTHYRSGGLGWRMRNFAQGDMWAHYNMLPNHLEVLSLCEVPTGFIEDFLPDPLKMVDWLLTEEEAHRDSERKSGSPSIELKRSIPETQASL